MLCILVNFQKFYTWYYFLKLLLFYLPYINIKDVFEPQTTFR